MKALLVIDMLKDFLNKDGALYCGDASRKIIPFVKEKIEEFHKNGNKDRIIAHQGCYEGMHGKGKKNKARGGEYCPP